LRETSDFPTPSSPPLFSIIPVLENFSTEKLKAVGYFLKTSLNPMRASNARKLRLKKRMGRLETAKMDVAIMGPAAPPVNLAEFKKPMTLPLDSVTNMAMTNGMMAATNPV
jgi:hypothetical protein